MSGNLSKSMRENYDTHGVDEYYKIVGSSYRNPHFPGIKLCMNIFMNNTSTDLVIRAYWFATLHAGGIGEVTIALQEWWTTCQTQNQSTPSAPARPAVPRPVVSPPRPVVVPLRPAVSPPIPTSSRAQPLAFPRISSVEPPLRIVATDPYTSDAYRTRTGLPCIPMSFHDVAVEGLPDASKVSFEEIESELKGEEKVDVADKDETVNADHGEATTATVEDSHPEDREIYDLVICSFALHLLTTPGSLYELLSTLSCGARWLVVLEPHKKPEIKEGWGWTLWDVTVWQEAQGREGEFVKESTNL
ncbi:methyltransferase domain protein [Rhizoctonia solani]|uniref:Methyltransferase domain protein n=1 Tax=Rhizoctonia solani TaxID=456999 RepID=A0A8H8NUQ6_9AGAM|nr:methyltransferase domain protein [Rhizoctonia solani]QRW20239.1 methyltransferase domain protein [Rhizoctonia solani]